MSAASLLCVPCRGAVGQLEQRIVSLEEQVKNNRSEIVAMVKEVVASALPEIIAAVEAKLEEKLEQKMKKKNLVLINVDESEEPDCLPKVVEGACIALKINPADVEGTFRDGRPREGRPRIAKIQFRNSAARHQFLIGFRSVRSGFPTALNAWVRPDLTFAQRQQDQKLREELKLRREAGEAVKIHQGKIIPKV